MMRWLRWWKTPREEFDSAELLAEWFAIAAASGSPRGLTWVSFSEAGEVTWAQAKREWLALIPVVVQFEPVAGGALDDVPQARDPRAVIAVFRWVGRKWIPDARAIFNLTVEQLLERSGGNWQRRK